MNKTKSFRKKYKQSEYKVILKRKRLEKKKNERNTICFGTTPLKPIRRNDNNNCL